MTNCVGRVDGNRVRPAGTRQRIGRTCELSRTCGIIHMILTVSYLSDFIRRKSNDRETLKTRFS